jgi:hypothetical protein
MTPLEIIDRKWCAVVDQAVGANHTELRNVCPFRIGSNRRLELKLRAGKGSAGNGA